MGESNEVLVRGKPLAHWLERLQDTSDPTKSDDASHAIRSFGAAAGPAVPVLAEMMRRGRREAVCSNTLSALASAVPEALHELVGMLDVPASAILAIGAICESGVGARVIMSILAALRREFDRYPDFGTEPWYNHPESRTVEVLGRLFIGLGRIGPAAEPAVPELVRQFPRYENYLRRHLVEALAGISPRIHAAVPLLTDLLADREPEIRRAAAQALGKAGEVAEVAVGALTEALYDRSFHVRAAAHAALAAIPTRSPALPEVEADRSTGLEPMLPGRGRKRTTAPQHVDGVPLNVWVSHLLNADDEEHFPFWRIALALRQFGAAPAEWMPALITRIRRHPALFAPPEPGVRVEVAGYRGNDIRGYCCRAAGELLETLGPGAARYSADLIGLLTREFHPLLRQAVARAIGRCGPAARGAVGRLAEMLADSDRAVRLAAACALGDLGPEAKSATAALTAVLRDRSKTVRDAAATAISKIAER